MTKHVRVPAPVPKIIQSIVRPTGRRALLLAVSCTALLVLGGGGYLWAHSVLAPASPPAHPPTVTKVLGSSTKAGSQTVASASPRAAADQPAQSQAQANQPAATPAAPAAADTDVSVGAGDNASFDINVASSQIKQQAGAIHAPFTISRKGGLSTPITPGEVTVTAGGMLIGVNIQSEAMLGSDNGELVIVPIGISNGTLNVHFSASSGDAMASTDFHYKFH